MWEGAGNIYRSKTIATTTTKTIVAETITIVVSWSCVCVSERNAEESIGFFVVVITKIAVLLITATTTTAVTKTITTIRTNNRTLSYKMNAY